MYYKLFFIFVFKLKIEIKMKNIRFLIIVLIISACNTMPQKTQYYSINEAIKNGEFNLANALIHKTISSGSISDDSIYALHYKIDLMKRIEIDFCKTELQVRKELEKKINDYSEEDFKSWKESNELENRIINGEKRFFRNAVPNLFRVNKTLRGEYKKDNVDHFKEEYIPKVIDLSDEKGSLFDSRRIKVELTVVLDANIVPEGALIRCWLPYPRTQNRRLSKIEFLAANCENYIIAPENKLQRSIYLEKKSVKNEKLKFNVSYIISTNAQYFNFDSIVAKTYNKNSELYKKYTKEELPHIILDDEIKNLAKQIVGNETNPVEQVRLIFYWLHDNIPWASALEYSIMPCIPKYVIENKKGDCGMQTFLFLSLTRSLGIPSKWQSGWYLLPDDKNLHDWAEVYFEGVGWVPVDPSFKRTDLNQKNMEDFYLGGIDSYRLIINDDVSQDFYPAKIYPRSEPYDFQRGELEWKGGNLYFNHWDYHISITYL